MENNWEAIVSLTVQIKKCDELGLITPSIAMCYICIDAMANLSRPVDKKRVTRIDFINWVDQYVKAHPEQKYKYRGKDVYAARCAFLHTYGSKAELHKKDEDLMEFGYHDGGRHSFDPSIKSNFVIIATRSFTHDVVSAVTVFLDTCASDPQLKKLVQSRLPGVLGLLPID